MGLTRFAIHAATVVAVGVLAGVALVYAALMFARDGVFGF